MKIRGYAWNEATGNPQASVDVDLIKREPSGSTVDTTTTDADGMWEFQENGNPYGVVDILIDDPGGFRRGFGDVSLFRTGWWSDAEQLETLAVLNDGVIPNIGSELEITAPGGMFVRVGTGLAKVKEAPCRYYTTEDLAVSANSSGDDRLDMVVVRLTRTGDDAGKTLVAIKTGSISLTQDANTWEIELARISVPDSAVAITVFNISDQRTFASYPVGGLNASDIGSGNVSNTEFDYLDNVTSPIQTQLNGKASSSHGHARASGFSVTIGDGINPVPTGYYMLCEIPKILSITAGRIWADTSTTATFDYFLEDNVSWDTGGTPWEDPSDSICGGNVPTLTSAVLLDLTLTTWDVSWNTGQFLVVKVITNNNARQLTFSFRYNETV